MIVRTFILPLTAGMMSSMMMSAMAGAETYSRTPVSSQPAADLCQILSKASRALPATSWEVRDHPALASTLAIEERRWEGYPAVPWIDPIEARIAASPEIVERLSLSSMATLFIEHAPGSDLYQATTFQGTLHEQGSLFIRKTGPASFEILPTPASATGGEWSTEEDLGVIAGVPVIVDHGRNTSTALDEDIQLTPWTGSSFGPACRVALRFEAGYKIAARFCGDPVACRTAGEVALVIARKFGGQDRWAEGEFGFGPPPSPKAAAFAASLRDQGPRGELEFPLFAAKDEPYRSWSGVDFTPFPYIHNGKTYTAAIGHEGVAWRAGTSLLFALYAPGGNPPAPLAGFVVKKIELKLTSATVIPASLEPKRP